MAAPYRSIEEMLHEVSNPSRFVLLRILNENRAMFLEAPGSKHNHQAWRGGYHDHVTETMNLVYVFSRPSDRDFRSALKICFLHDIEKPWRFVRKDDGRVQECMKSKKAKADFRDGLMEDYGVVLTREEENAMRYVEGEHRKARPSERVAAVLVPENGIRYDADFVNAFTYIEGSHGDYRNSARAEGPLATFCHLWWTKSYVVMQGSSVAADVGTLYRALDALRPLPFSLADAEAVIRLYVALKEGGSPYPGSPGPKGWEALRDIVRYPGEDPLPYRMGPLAGLCHMCDVASARLWPQHPLAKDDPWAGAVRANP